MIEVTVPEAYGIELVVRYAGGDPVTYEVVDGRAQVEERHLEAFMATFPGVEPAPPADAEPASEEKE